MKEILISVLFIINFLIICDAKTQNLPHSVSVIQKDDINGVVITKNGKKLVVYGYPKGKEINVDKLLLTHCRRDLLWAAKSMIESGVKTYVPDKEFDLFTKIDSFWTDFVHLRYHDYQNQTTKYPINPLDISNKLYGGDTIVWEGIQLLAINTPGYTRGALSYFCEINGKKIAFTGDLIYGNGQIFDLYSLQDEISEYGIDGYHGYISRASDLINSLKTIQEFNPDIIIPARGPVILNPPDAIEKLINNLQLLYCNYLSTSTYRWFTGNEKQLALAERMGIESSVIKWMPSAKIKDAPPKWIRHIGNSNLIASETGEAFLVDCGSKRVYEKLIDDQEKSDYKNINGIFVTHYHDDHTEYIQDLVEMYHCPVYVGTNQLKDVLFNPKSYRLPAMINKSIKNVNIVEEGYKMQWNEFTFTFYDFPGQTIYHNALLVERNKCKVFFIGDSFSPTGMDDYCLQNRNILQEGKGYHYCIGLLRKMPSDVWLVNQHIHKLFRFSNKQLDFMERKLREREAILSELSPWEDINYLIDEQWARIYPYGIEMQQGQDNEFSVVITNHQNNSCTYFIKPNTYSNGLSFSPSEMELVIPGQQEGKTVFTLSTSRQCESGLQVITADIQYNNKYLHEWCEGMVNVKEINKN